MASIDGRSRMLLGQYNCGPAAAFDFLYNAVTRCITLGWDLPQQYKVVSVTSSGYVLRSDILASRLRTIEHVEQIFTFPRINQFMEPAKGDPDDFDALLNILTASIGAISIGVDSAAGFSSDRISLALDKELAKRLNLRFLLEDQPHKMRVAFMRGRASFEDGALYYRAAKALGISLVVFDKPGTWIESEKWSEWREAFVPVDFQEDTLPQEAERRFTEAISQYPEPIDGVLTAADVFIPMANRIAKRMGLPHANTDGLYTILHKEKLRAATGLPSLLVTKREDLDEVEKEPRFRYPLIFKPAMGWNSESVSKIDTKEELYAAWDGASASCLGRHMGQVVIENFCTGPEIDLQLVISDGELIFTEASDDLTNEEMKLWNKDVPWQFLELSSRFPSAVPERELTTVREQLHAVIKQLDLQNGLYHCEARVYHSSVEYRTGIDGTMSLQPRKDIPADEPGPSCFMIEVNPRPPGYDNANALVHAHGIDYSAIALALAVGDKTRTRALSTGFKGGPAGFHELLWIPAERAGTFQGEDPIEELKKRRPHLKKAIQRSWVNVTHGQKVPEPKAELLPVAVVLVWSKKSRVEARRLAEEVRREVRYEIV